VEFLRIKANVLKQLAAPTSRDLSRQSEANDMVVEAIRCLCLACSMEPGSKDQWQEEIEALMRIAGRVGVLRRDLPFLDGLGGLDDWKGRYFTPEQMQGQVGAQNWNMAVECVKSEDRSTAALWYKRALPMIGEDSSNARAFKATVAYQYGLCLLKMHGMEGLNVHRLSGSQKQAAAKIRPLWQQALRLCASLDDTSPEDHESTGRITRAILGDPLMRGDLRFHFGMRLANEGKKAEARDLLEKALEDLDDADPEDRQMIAQAHIRLAALCNDTGRLEESGQHAHWVLRNVPDLDDMVRMMMELNVRRAEGEF
jgi:hypothetical protein